MVVLTLPKRNVKRERFVIFSFNLLVELHAYCGNVIVQDIEIILKKSFVC